MPRVPGKIFRKTLMALDSPNVLICLFFTPSHLANRSLRYFASPSSQVSFSPRLGFCHLLSPFIAVSFTRRPELSVQMHLWLLLTFWQHNTCVGSPYFFRFAEKRKEGLKYAKTGRNSLCCQETFFFAISISGSLGILFWWKKGATAACEIFFSSRN